MSVVVVERSTSIISLSNIKLLIFVLDMQYCRWWNKLNCYILLRWTSGFKGSCLMQPGQLAEQAKGDRHGRDRSVRSAGCFWNMQSRMPTAQSLYVAVGSVVDKTTEHSLAPKTVKFLFLYALRAVALPISFLQPALLLATAFHFRICSKFTATLRTAPSRLPLGFPTGFPPPKRHPIKF